MRKFKSISSAKAIADMTDKAITFRQWSEAEGVWLIKFSPRPRKSQFMAGLV